MSNFRIDPNKPAVIMQPQCLGDLVYIQKLIKELSLRHSEVIIPVYPQFLEIQEYFFQPDNVFYYNYNEDFPYKSEYQFISGNRSLSMTVEYIRIMLVQNKMYWYPLGTSWIANIRRSMEYKYFIAKVDPHNWQEDTLFVPNLDKAEALVEELGLDLNDSYCLVNRNFGLKSLDVKNTSNNYIACVKYKNGVYKIDPPELPVVEMQIMDGYSLFDWYYVIKHANCIHTIETSLCYLLELIGGDYMNSDDNQLYTRWYPSVYGKELVQNIFTRVPWNYIDDDAKFPEIGEKFKK